MRRRSGALLTAGLVVALASRAGAQDADVLVEAFRTPPASAQPRVWWHWLNGNVTQDGIDKDLAWMKRQGVGGAQMFDGAFPDPGGPFHTPTVVAKPLVYMTPEWRAAFRHAVARADALGLDFGIASSPGWSESGGPWVGPRQAMKKLVWSELTVTGGRRIDAVLPAPPSTTGPFQTLPLAASDLDAAHPVPPKLYGDVAVVAYRTPRVETRGLPTPRITASSPIDGAALIDGDLTRSVQLPFAAGAESWVRFDYGAPQTLRALTLVAAKAGGFGPGFGATGPAGRIEASRDGVAFTRVAALPVDGAPQETVAFPAVTARYVRVVFLPRKASASSAIMGAPTPTYHDLAELRFEAAARVHRFEGKGGWAVVGDLVDQPTPEVASDAVVDRREVIDLTARLKPDGSLDWTPPPGRWTILRFGYSLIGTQNHPASAAGTGLEVDKLSRAHVSAYLKTYLDLYADAAGPGMMGARGVREMVNDSWEAGAQNWTETLPAEFQARRGYNPRPWMPVLAGRVVQSARASDAFLFDLRLTLGEMLADNHYAVFSEALHARGMARYGESHESGRAFIGDGMQVKKTADVPMSATWAENPPGAGPTNYDADVRESASVAHLYGQNVVAAESFTTAGNPFGYSPALLKPVADRMMADGLNRFVIHTSVHQPVDAPGPGLTLAVFGQWFTRKETWAEQAHAWTAYLARSSALLQQGRFIADAAVLYPEDRNITELYGAALPEVPAGYAYDFVNADALIHLLRAEGGRAVAPSGASYGVVVVDPRMRRMTLPVMRKLHELARAGVRVVGAAPVASPSLMDDPAEVRRLAAETFAPQTGARPASALAALLAREVTPDMDDAGAGLRDVHRRLADGDLYFVSNLSDTPKVVNASFRVSGHPAELWRAQTGEIAAASYRQVGARTFVRLRLGPHEAVFVVFRGAGPSERHVPEPRTAVLATLDGGWRLQFPADQVARAGGDVAALSSWTESADPQVRYFSGTACYTARFDASDTALASGGRRLLDLGAVKEVADVTLNGQPLGVAWTAPYRVDVGQALRTGANLLKVCVANLWPNRLIGDKQPGAVAKAFTAYNPYPANAPFRPSGLLGPVTLLRVGG